MAADNIPHGLVGYRRYKHRCSVCKAANAKDQRERRARAQKAIDAAAADNVRTLRPRQQPVKKRPSKPVAVPDPPPEPEPPDELPGPVETAVITVCEKSPVAAERPDLVAMAMCLAKVMDNTQVQKDHTPASRQLSSLMAQLNPVAQTKMKGRLVTIKKMTNRVQAPTGTK